MMIIGEWLRITDIRDNEYVEYQIFDNTINETRVLTDNDTYSIIRSVVIDCNCNDDPNYKTKITFYI